MKENFSASRTCRPEQGLRQLVDSRSDEAKHAEDFSAARREADPAERARDLQIPNFKGNGAVGGFTFSRENASQRFLEHQLWDGNPVFRRFLRGHCRNVLAPAKHRETICDLEDLFKAMSYVNDRNARRFQRLHHREQLGLFDSRKRRSRFVQDEYPDIVLFERVQDRNRFAFHLGKLFDGLGQIDLERKPGYQAVGASAHPRVVDAPEEPASRRLLTEEYILVAG